MKLQVHLCQTHTGHSIIYWTFVPDKTLTEVLHLFQEGAAVSRNGEAEERDSGAPPKEQTSASRGHSSDDGPSTNSNTVSVQKLFLNFIMYCTHSLMLATAGSPTRLHCINNLLITASINRRKWSYFHSLGVSQFSDPD